MISLEYKKTSPAFRAITEEDSELPEEKKVAPRSVNEDEEAADIEVDKVKTGGEEVSLEELLEQEELSEDEEAEEQ